MDFRNIIVTEVSGLNERGKPKSYIFLDKIPKDLIDTFTTKVKNSGVSLDNFTVSISSWDGGEVFNISKGAPLSEGYYAYLELELREMFQGFTEEGDVILSEDYFFVAHFWFQGVAVCIELPKEDLNIETSMVREKLKEEGLDSQICKSVNDRPNLSFKQTTQTFTTDEEIFKFINEIQSDDYVRNIIT